MRRVLLAALSLLLLISSGASARTLVVRAPDNASGSYSSIGMNQVQGWLDQSLSTSDVKPWSSVDTTAYRTFYVRDTLLHTGTQYDAIVVPDVYAEGWSAAGAKYDPFTATRISRWPIGPLVLIGGYGTHNTVKLADNVAAGGDTTGIQTNTGPWNANSGFSYRFYDVKTTASWFGYDATFPLVSGTKPASSTVFRPIVAVGRARYQISSSFTPYAFYDELVAPVANPDTVALLVRYPPAKNTSPVTKAPIVICNASGYPGNWGSSLIGDALAIADSASGHKVFDNPAGLPIRGSLVWGPLISSGSYANASTGKTGVFCRSDSCDSSRTLGAATDTMIARGLRITATFQVDTAAAGLLSWQIPYIQKLGANVRLVPQVYRGTSQGRLNGINDPVRASKHMLMDVLGETRTRALIPPGATGLPCACADADSSIYCLLKSMYAKADSLFPGKIDHTLMAPVRAWSNSITRSNGRTLDSLLWVFYWAGVRAIETDPLNASSPSGAGPIPELITRSGYVPVYDAAGAVSGRVGNRRAIYQMPVLATRQYELSGAAQPLSTAHDELGEFWHGRFVSPWFPSPYMLYQHDFQTRLYTIHIATNSVGGAGQGTTPMNYGLRNIARAGTEQALLNRLAGRTIWLWDFAENVATQGVIR